MFSKNPIGILEALSRVAPIPIVGVDAQGLIDLWSSAASRFFGWSFSELKGQPLPWGDVLESAVHREQHPIRTRLRAKAGELLDVEFQLTVRESEFPNAKDPARGGWLIVFTDLSAIAMVERERNSFEIRENESAARFKAESRFRELLEAAPDPILEVDQHGRIVLCNGVSEKVFGYSREELLGMKVEMLLPEASRGNHDGHRAGFMHTPSIRPMGRGRTLLAARKDGTAFPVEVSLSPVQSEDGLRVTAIVRDVSERKRAEEEIHAINQQLAVRNKEIERANRLKSEFLASMSHELRTPLHTIIGFAELLGEEVNGPLNEKQKRFLLHVNHDSLHLLALINDVLDLSKIEAGRMELHRELFDSKNIFVEAMAGIENLATPKNVTVDDHVTPGIFIYADRTRFREILNNLLSNAVKFTPEGGRVWVDARIVAATAGSPEVARFSIFDTGIGIAPENQAAVFDKFRQISSTTRGVREGTGLGLAIVKHLVEMHGGSMTLDSEVGRGSNFAFTMPTTRI